MSPHWKIRIPLMIGLAVAVLRFTGGSAVAGALPKDPCALLNPAEIQPLDSNAKIGPGVSDASMAPLGVACTYTWGPRTPQWGESVVTITVIDASKAWPGRSPDIIAQGLLLKVKTDAPNASQISGVGDAAVFTYEPRSYNGTAEAYFKAKEVELSIRFHSGNALQNKEKLITLLKAAAARL